MGSVLFLASWAVLMGPVQYVQHLISGPRLPFTAAYFGSITLTLVFAIKVSLHFLCILSAHNHHHNHYRIQSAVSRNFRNMSADQSLT